MKVGGLKAEASPFMLLVRVLDTYVILFRSRLNLSVPSAVFFPAASLDLDYVLDPVS